MLPFSDLVDSLCKASPSMRENAAELIHIGQAMLTTGGTIEYFRDTVFNDPALAEADKVAVLNGLNTL